MALVPFAAAFFMGIEVTALRYIAQRDSTGTAMVWTNAVGLLISACFMPFVWSDPTWEQAGLIFLIGLITVSGQVLMVAAMAEGEASLLAPLFYSTLVYASLYGWLAFAEVPAPWSWAGIGLIMVSGIWLARSNRDRAAMMFIPSIGGISHHFTENSSDEDIALGAKVYVDAARRMLDA